MEKLLSDDNFKDFSFYIDNKEIKVHRCVLALYSDYFRTMFNSSLVQGSSIEIHEISFEIFFKIITFIYTDKIKIENDFLDLVYFSDMFDIKRLQKVCTNYLNKNIDIDQFVEMLEFLSKYLFMRKTIVNIIIGNWREIVEKDKFFDIIGKDNSLLKDLLQNSKLVKREKISEKDKGKITKILKDKSITSTPEITHRINDILNETSLFNNPKNIEIVFNELKITIPEFFKKYL